MSLSKAIIHRDLYAIKSVREALDSIQPLDDSEAEKSKASSKRGFLFEAFIRIIVFHGGFFGKNVRIHDTDEPFVRDRPASLAIRERKWTTELAEDQMWNMRIRSGGDGGADLRLVHVNGSRWRVSVKFRKDESLSADDYDVQRLGTDRSVMVNAGKESSGTPTFYIPSVRIRNSLRPRSISVRPRMFPTTRIRSSTMIWRMLNVNGWLSSSSYLPNSPPARKLSACAFISN